MHAETEKSDAMIRRTAIIVAAGQGLRAGGMLPKQYRDYLGKPLVRYSAELFAQSGYFADIIVVIAQGQDELALAALQGLDNITIAYGGDTRQKSVRNGLSKAQEIGAPQQVFIHDAARPGLSLAVIENLMTALDNGAAAVPVLPLVDSVSNGGDDILGTALDRTKIWRIQTPQAFAFETIMDAHTRLPPDEEPTDDARIAQAAGYEVAMVEGSESLHKITFSEDFMDDRSTPQSSPPLVRTGFGFDVHRLASGEELWIGGIQIPYDKGLSGHSDADVALHAITDAVLGAIAQGDIGDHFPPSDPQWKGARSDEFLAFAAKLARSQNCRINNIDLTIICEAPKIGPHRDAMRERIAKILDLDVSRISVKATTTERLGATGRGEGIAAQAIATVSQTI